MDAGEDGDDSRDGAKRRGVSIGPQANQILQRLYEPNLGPGSPADDRNPLSPKKRPHPTQYAVLKPKFQTRMKKNASVATIPNDVPSRMRAGVPTPIAATRITPLSTSSSIMSLAPGVMHPSLHKASERVRTLQDKPHTTMIRTSTLADNRNQNGGETGSYACLSPASKAAQRKALATESSFTASLNLDPRYLKEFKSGNFLYLRKKKNTDLIMYALEVVEHFEVDRSDYYTMSLEGVTHFTTEHSEFWTLDKWETEYSRFMKMLAIPFFQKYKLWKNFNMWKTSVRTFKMRNAKKALNERLFLLAPSLQSTLLGLRSLCLDVTKLELIHFSARQTYSLRDFELEQQKTRTQVTQQLAGFSAKSLRMCVKACDDVIDSFLMANKISADHKMTFMERAALRKQCRILTSFLRLADFLTIDATIQLTVRSFQQLYAILAAGKAQLTAAPASVTSGNTQPNSKNPGKSGQPSAAPPFTAIFAVAVEMDSASSALNATPTHDAWNGALQRALKEALRMVETPARHLGHESLAPYTTASAEDEGKDVWSVEQLNVALILNEDAKFSMLTNDIFVALDEAFEAVEDYMDVFTPFHQIYAENEGQVTHLMETYANAPLDFFSESVEKYRSQVGYFPILTNASLESVL
ncbi:hypothetical protein PC116_g16460 [Phytophthora cactorum]|nr:hypothetical protein PC116_g16460 [Phytophthora cactorum]